MDTQIVEIKNDIVKLYDLLHQQGEQIVGLQQKRERAAKREFKAALLLTEIKTAFLQSEPNQRQDPFTDEELVLWAAYILSGTPRKEKLTSYEEIAKRRKRTKELVQHFIELTLNQPVENAENWARTRTKDYLEYVLLSIPEIQTKDGVKPNNFWIATSDWMVNQYQNHIGEWQIIKTLKDEPLTE